MADKSDWLEYWVDPQTWEFRGDFEGMYRDFDDPWECRKRVCELRRDISLLMLFRERRYRHILDIGCGLGAFTERLRIANRGDPATILGVDVSNTAVIKARAQFAQCRFEVCDVMRDPLPRTAQPWDLVLVSELIWYILPSLSELLGRIRDALAPTGVLFVQQFYPTEQRFGLEYLSSPAELHTRYLEPTGFRRQHELLEQIECGQVQLVSLTKAP